MDRISKEKRSKVMQAIKSTGTKPEEMLRKALFAEGYRYRKHYTKYNIDIAFPSKKVAVFVDGCFWHMCPDHGHFPKSNKDYWVPKLKRNVERDKRYTKELKEQGWKVIRIWECEVKEDLENAVNKVENALQD